VIFLGVKKKGKTEEEERGFLGPLNGSSCTRSMMLKYPSSINITGIIPQICYSKILM